MNLRETREISDYEFTRGGEKLSEEDAETINNKLSMLKDEKKCTLIYRGEEKTKLFSNYKCSDLRAFSYKLFLIGSKGKSFLDNLILNKSKWNLADDTSYLFEELFRLLNDILNSSDPKVRAFSWLNKELANYFKNRENVKSFLNGIDHLNENDKIKVRDYYLSILHQYSDEHFYPISIFQSVSTDYDCAKKFAGNGREAIVLFGWLPLNKGKNKYTIIYDYLNSIEEILSNSELPKCKYPFYPEEKEISIKGGILPHYLIGYSYYKFDTESCLEINPSLLKLKENSISWIENGLPIDQRGFNDLLKNTNYKDAFLVDSKGKYRNQNN